MMSFLKLNRQNFLIFYLITNFTFHQEHYSSDPKIKLNFLENRIKNQQKKTPEKSLRKNSLFAWSKTFKWEKSTKQCEKIKCLSLWQPRAVSWAVLREKIKFVCSVGLVNVNAERNCWIENFSVLLCCIKSE